MGLLVGVMKGIWPLKLLQISLQSFSLGTYLD